jgi:hypothetical protein
MVVVRLCGPRYYKRSDLVDEPCLDWVIPSHGQIILMGTATMIGLLTTCGALTPQRALVPELLQPVREHETVARQDSSVCSAEGWVTGTASAYGDEGVNGECGEAAEVDASAASRTNGYNDSLALMVALCVRRAVHSSVTTTMEVGRGSTASTDYAAPASHIFCEGASLEEPCLRERLHHGYSCGRCIEVCTTATTSSASCSGPSATVVVTDQCRATGTYCAAGSNHLDLSTLAFSRIASLPQRVSSTSAASRGRPSHRRRARAARDRCAYAGRM